MILKILYIIIFFFFKQKTAYEMRISDWSSDVCSSDLNALNALKKDQAVKSGNIASINKIVNEYVLPYVNLEKTTRLAAGRYWRQATPKQQHDLVEAFKGTLIRTYSGAFTRIDQQSAFAMQPFRGAAKADDVVVRSTLSQGDRKSPRLNSSH